MVIMTYLGSVLYVFWTRTHNLLKKLPSCFLLFILSLELFQLNVNLELHYIYNIQFLSLVFILLRKATAHCCVTPFYWLTWRLKDRLVWEMEHCVTSLSKLNRGITLAYSYQTFSHIQTGLFWTFYLFTYSKWPAIESQARCWSDHWEQFGFNCLPQGHFDTWTGGVFCTCAFDVKALTTHVISASPLLPYWCVFCGSVCPSSFLDSLSSDTVSNECVYIAWLVIPSAFLPVRIIVVFLLPIKHTPTLCLMYKDTGYCIYSCTDSLGCLSHTHTHPHSHTHTHLYLGLSLKIHYSCECVIAMLLLSSALGTAVKRDWCVHLTVIFYECKQENYINKKQGSFSSFAHDCHFCLMKIR